MQEGTILELPSPRPGFEIKPKERGLLVKNLTENERKTTGKVDYLIVCGQGPVLDEDTLQKPDDKKEQVRETAISWMKTIARATGELKLAGMVDKIVLTGGKTGGEKYTSEAELMKRILVEEYHISEQDIIIEDGATNTLTNFALSLNKIDDLSVVSRTPSIGLMGSDFHIARIKLLAHLFGVDNPQSFSAEQIFRLIAYKTNDEELHQILDGLLNMDQDLSFPGSRFKSGEWEQFINSEPEKQLLQPSRSLRPRHMLTHFELERGNESRGIHARATFESFLTRGMLEVPEFWFGYLYYLNDRRLVTIINNTSEETLSHFGIRKDMQPTDIREILKPYTISKKEGGKRLMLEEFYQLFGISGDNLVVAQAKAGTSVLESTRQRLERIAQKIDHRTE